MESYTIRPNAGKMGLADTDFCLCLRFDFGHAVGVIRTRCPPSAQSIFPGA